jgi:putative transposase
MITASDNCRRRSLRLSTYDYTLAGAYFVTICTHERACLFGEIIDETMHSSGAGKMVNECWLAIRNTFPTVYIDEYVVMPNHVHGILILPGPGASVVSAKTTAGTRYPSLGIVVGSFKSRSTVLYTHGVRQAAWPTFHQRLWQRNYYDRIIRDDQELARAREYIHNNPLQWSLDRENPDHQIT